VRNTRELGDIRDQLVYIAPLFPEEFHILALAEIRSIRDLAGKTVNLDHEGSATISGKPVRSLMTQTQADGFHFVEIPYAPDLQQDYLPSTLKHEDYPNLIRVGDSVDTISVNSVLMGYNWPPPSERFRLLESFVRTLFSRIAEFQTGPHHPKWQEVNVAATLPGWRRFGPAEHWNERKSTEAELHDHLERFRDHCRRHCQTHSPYLETVRVPLLNLFGK
jgi:uncharacterized protein